MIIILLVSCEKAFFYRFYDNLSVVALGTFVFCGVSGAAIFMGVSAAGGISALEDRWDQVCFYFWSRQGVGDIRPGKYHYYHYLFHKCRKLNKVEKYHKRIFKK